MTMLPCHVSSSLPRPSPFSLRALCSCACCFSDLRQMLKGPLRDPRPLKQLLQVRTSPPLSSTSHGLTDHSECFLANFKAKFKHGMNAALRRSRYGTEREQKVGKRDGRRSSILVAFSGGPASVLVTTFSTQGRDRKLTRSLRRALLDLVKNNLKEPERNPKDRRPPTYTGIEVAYIDESGVPGAVVRLAAPSSETHSFSYHRTTRRKPGYSSKPPDSPSYPSSSPPSSTSPPSPPLSPPPPSPQPPQPQPPQPSPTSSPPSPQRPSPPSAQPSSNPSSAAPPSHALTRSSSRAKPPRASRSKPFPA